MTVFVETNQFNQMISYKPYVNTKQEKRKVKYSLLDRIKEGVGDKWYRYKEGTKQAFDMICFFSAELGFFYAGDEYLAERHEVSDRTIRRNLKGLIDLGQVIKVHRRNKKCNGRGKPIYLFVHHPYFKYWVELLGLKLDDVHTDVQTENAEIPCDSREEQPKKVPTYSLPKKQESNIYIGHNKVVQYVVNRVNDSIKQGTKIPYLSSYIDRIVRSLENQAVFEEAARQAAARKKREEEASKRIKELLNNKEPKEYQRKVPFYNWLEG